METSFFDREAGQFVCDFVERLPTTGTGRPFVLYDWQSRVITEFYGQMAVDEDGAPFRQYQYLYLEIPKKNGKSELAAALGVYHLFADGELNAEVYVVAADKDNAGIVFGAAQYMLESAPFTAKMLARGELKIIESQKKVVYRQKRRTGNGNKKWVTVGQMKVLSSEAFSKHGYKPSCVIFDELHAQPNRDLWDVMTFGAGDARRQPVWIVLTTAGDDPDRTSIGWEIHEKAVAIRDARALKNVLAKGGDPRAVLSLRHCEDETLPGKMTELLEQDNPVWLPILYGLTALFGDDPDDLEKIDIWDEALWQMVNPSLGHHLKLRMLRVEAKDARRFEANEKLFRWLRLNQWISVKAVSWLPLSLYDKCQWNGDPETLLGKICYGGVDLSSTTDLTAFVLLFPIQPGLDKAVTLFRAWRPGLDAPAAEKRDHVPYRDWARAGFLTLSEGNLVDYEDVIAAITDAMARYQLKMVGFDPYLSRTITARLTAAGVPNIEIPQDLKNMSPAMKELQEGMLRRELLHIHNTCGRWCFGNVRNYVDGNGNMKPLKDKSTGRIDITVAWIIVVAVWMIVRNQPATISDQIDNGTFGL